MKRNRVFVFLCVLAALLITGCDVPTVGSVKKDAGLSLTAENEILTYEKIDSKKTTLIVSITGNVEVSGFCAAFEAEHPDIQTIVIDVTGGNSHSHPAIDCIEHGMLPDIVLTTTNTFPNELYETSFEKLSSKPYIDSYQTEALNRAAVNGNIYWLPGPSKVDCIIYNKTMFDEHGWETPGTFDEFVELCKQIREETNGEIQPWNPNAKYDNELITAINAFAYSEVYGGVENRTWYRNFLDEKATFKGHMEPYFGIVQRLIDEKLLLPEHFSYSATTRQNEFREGKIAMLNASLSMDFSDSPYEFDFIPFPGKTQSDCYLSDYFSCCISMPKKDSTEKTREAALAMLEFFGTEAGQRAFIGKNIMISNVKNVEIEDSARLNGIRFALDSGNMFEKIDFYSKGKETLFSIHSIIKSMTEGTMTSDQAIAMIDAHPYSALNDSTEAEREVIATASKDFTMLEVSNYFADMYREKTGADIGLIENNTVFRGNVMRIFAGELSIDDVTVLKPRSQDNGACLEKLVMTGKQLVDALNAPLGRNDTVADCIYAFSGLKCEVAPWKPVGEKYVSITLADGSPIDNNKEYTVAVWGNTIAEQYISHVAETYEGTWEELLTEKLKADGSIAPAYDNRIKLIW